MEELVKNPDGCAQFAPNPFKKEKCKNCGRQWFEHLGAIDQAVVDGYQKARQKVVDEKLRQEAEAKEKQRAKAAAKKKANQAVEDQWLFEENQGQAEHADDSDDDMGFRMFTAGDLDSAPIDRSKEKRGSDSKLKVVNLIDFSELHAQHDEEDRTVVGGSSSSAAPAREGADDSPDDAAGEKRPSVNGALPPDVGCGTAEADCAEVARLEHEIEYLRMLLDNAKAEAQIQVEIVKDEVADKQKRIGDLESHCAESSRAAEAARAEAELHRAEVDRLRKEVEGLKGGGAAQASAPAAVPASSAVTSQIQEALKEIEALRAENKQLHSEVQALGAAAQASSASAAAAAAAAPAGPSPVQAANEALARQTTEALREMRLNAEQHLAWIRQRISSSQKVGAAAIPTDVPC
eukprot:TRINITY_DN92431_c0_g1_i1.p1 TRINITY_DN92431_c0_g1~~TRINITY_DN92431_c0_g1_i1.p1  ORF type:complete len:406 (+),score=133.29 TRINITY_DN92431_c0_g1_i1:273-1490(+)